MDSSSTVSVAAVASAAAEPAAETCQLGNSETNSTTVASATSITAPKQQRGNKNRNNHKKNDTPNNESNPSSSSKQGNKNNSNNNNKNSNPNNATRQQRNSGSNSKASTANHERYNLSVNDSAVNDITNKSSPTSNSAYGNGKKQQQWSGPKKQNLNHLLNFTYESQRDNENYYEYERQGRQFWSTKLAKNSYFSKEQFLQANCQFLVKSGSGNDYSVHMSDPDRLVEWEKIEEVHIDSHSPISCPICLHEPTAGKMTKCGHVYCWSCLLHYLSLSDKPWRKCPICYESVYKCDLKSARVIKNSREYKVGDEIEMQLVCKPRDLKYSTVCVAASDIHRVVETNNSVLSYETLAKLPAACATYLKLHSYSPKRIHEMVIQREREELNKQLEAEKDQPEVCFVSEALVLLDEREAKLIEEINRGSEATKRRHHSSNMTAKVEASVEPVAANFAAVEKPSIRYVDAFDEEVATDVDNKSVTDNNPKEVVEESKQDLAPTTTQPPKEEEKHEEIKTPKSSSSSGSSQLEMAFFYQSADGQRIFISGFNNRCLLSEYTSLSHAPDRIRARIIASDSLFMSEDNRRHRYKYLAHLPLHSEFKIVELDLESASPSRILSDKTLETFREEFADRRRSRERKIAREKRECDRLAAQAAERELAYVPHYYVQSAMTDVNRTRDTIVSGGYLNEFPEASSSPPLSSGASLLSENSSNMSTTASSSSASANSANSDPALVAQMSFAQKLKNTSTTNNTTAWPTLDQFSSTTVSTSTTTTLGGWVNMAKQQQAQMSMSGRAKRCQNAPAPWSDKAAAPASRTSISGDDGEPEREEKESMPAPSYKQSFFSAIDETLRLIDAKKETTEEDKLAADSATSTNATTTNKKKKKTKQLLFSTSLNRAF